MAEAEPKTVETTNTNAVENLVKNGRQLFAMGKLQQAEATFRAVLELDPEHKQAAFYLSLISERKQRLSANKRWSTGLDEMIYPTLPMRRIGKSSDESPGAKVYFTPPGREEILRKLQTIRLNTISFDDLPLSTALKQLSEATKQRDPETNGIVFTSSSTNANVSIKLSLRNVRVTDVLDAILKVTDAQLKYSVEETGVAFADLPPAPPPELFNKSFNIDLKAMTNAFDSLIGFTSSQAPVEKLKDYFMAAGVDLAPPRYLFLNETRGMILVRATQDELETVGAAIDVINSPPAVPEK
ncbi:MAG: Type secretion system protein [Verrucomicrobiales bacterium]|nr:Type secretion system protein [Verrucomicrobiales bacterium]